MSAARRPSWGLLRAIRGRRPGDLVLVRDADVRDEPSFVAAHEAYAAALAAVDRAAADFRAAQDAVLDQLRPDAGRLARAWLRWSSAAVWSDDQVLTAAAVLDSARERAAEREVELHDAQDAALSRP